MKTITRIDANAIAHGLLEILLDMEKKNPDKEPSIPVDYVERMVMETKGVDLEEAKKVTEKVISTGILRWSIFENTLVI